MSGRILLLLGLSLAPAIVSALSIVPGSVQFREVINSSGKEFYVLKIEGAIAYPMAIEVRDLFKTKMQTPKALLVDLNSGGGSFREGMEIITLLRREKINGREVSTTVENGKICGSMCVPLYLQGKNRYAGMVSSFMFHGMTNGALTNIPDEEKTRQALNIFIDAGVSVEWLDLMWSREVFSAPGQYWMTGKELIEENSGIVTHLLSRHEIFEPVESPIDPNIGAY